MSVRPRASISLFVLSHALLLASSSVLASSAPAEPLIVPSRIDKVIVYPDAASVTRVIEAQLPAGETSLILRGLPAGLDPASLRVEGQGAFVIGAVESRLAPAESEPNQAIVAQLRALREERAIIETRVEVLEARRAMVQRYGEASPEKLGPESRPLDPQAWPGVWDLVGAELARSGEDLRLARARLRDVEESINALESSTRPPEARGRPLRDVTVSLEAGAATTAKIALTYRVPGASWRPIYDARLVTDAKGAQVEFVRRAQVRQRTGEDWSGISLLLSTARATGGVAAPQVHTERLSFYEPEAPMRMARPIPAPAPMAADNQRLSAAPEPAREREATLEASAYDAAFAAPGRIDVPTDGSERNLRLSGRTIPVTISARTAPAFDQKAYLEVSFPNAEEAPLLAGEVAIHRDNLFVGRGRIEATGPDGEVRLGFGADDRIQVTRAPVRRKENEPGWIGSTKQETREFRTIVKNLHPFPVRTIVTDRMPISENAAIVIEQMSATTPPTTKNVDDRRGVLDWAFDLAPGAEKEIRLAYRMKWPADRTIVFETAPNPR